MDNNLEFEVLGIAETLKRYRLRVPPNQREYSWGEYGEVERLLHDISDAMRSGNNDTYFLGTIVLTKSGDDIFEIADGQQRLATTTMILAYIRDYFRSNKDEASANSIQNDFLFNYVVKAKEVLAHLSLNADDNLFFRNIILQVSGKRESTPQTRRSHRLISAAATEIKTHFENLEKVSGQQHFQNQLIDWQEYLTNRASVILLRVPNRAKAFIMFETLNDRGLKTSQADLVKNYLFGKAGDDRAHEAQNSWSRMRGALDTIGEEGDLTLDFLRLICCLLGGATREREIMERIEQKAKNKSDSMALLSFLEKASTDYAAILNSDHPKWISYDESVKRAIKTINLLGVTQIRPLILAISRHFTPAQTAKSFRRLVSWSIRILIGGTRGGKLDDAYARIANEIYEGKIKNDIALMNEQIKLVPTDALFKSSFEVARVSVNKLARYYLRSLETTALNEKYAELVPNEDSSAINLEHVMSQVPSGNLSEQDIETHYTRIGNMALLKADKNNLLGAKPFSEKRTIYRNSSFVLTKQLADVKDWNIETIEKRQKLLAGLAVKTWSIA